MSGGSYDYLCFSTGDIAELAGKQGQMHAMAERPEGLGCRHAARQTRTVLVLLKAAEHASEPLEAVWHAVEWRDSGDWGDDQLAQVCGEFEQRADAKGRLEGAGS